MNNNQLQPYKVQTMSGIMELFNTFRDDVEVHTAGWSNGYYDAHIKRWIPHSKSLSLKNGVLFEKNKIIGRINKQYNIKSYKGGYRPYHYGLYEDCIDQTNSTNDPLLIWKEIIHSAYINLIIAYIRYTNCAHNKTRNITKLIIDINNCKKEYKKCIKDFNKFIPKYIKDNKDCSIDDIKNIVNIRYTGECIWYKQKEWAWKPNYHRVMIIGDTLVHPRLNLTKKEREILKLKEQFEKDYNAVCNYTHLTYTFFKKNHNKESYKYMIQGYINKKNLDIKNTQEKYKKLAKEYIDNFLNDKRNEYSFWYLKEHINYQYFKYDRQFDRIEFISGISLNWKDFTECYKVISICNDNQLCIPDYKYSWKYTLKDRYLGYFYSKRTEDKDGILIEFDNLFIIPEAITGFVLDLIRLDKEEKLSKTAHIYIQELARITYTNFVMSKSQFIKKFLSKPVYFSKRTNVRWRKNNQK